MSQITQIMITSKAEYIDDVIFIDYPAAENPSVIMHLIEGAYLRGELPPSGLDVGTCHHTLLAPGHVAALLCWTEPHAFTVRSKSETDYEAAHIFKIETMYTTKDCNGKHNIEWTITRLLPTVAYYDDLMIGNTTVDRVHKITKGGKIQKLFGG